MADSIIKIIVKHNNRDNNRDKFLMLELTFAVHLELLKRLNLFTILTTDYITIYRHGESESFDVPDVL